MKPTSIDDVAEMMGTHANSAVEEYEKFIKELTNQTNENTK